MHIMSRLKRIAVVLVIALPVASVMTISSASASTVSARAVPGLYHCAMSANCDIVNANKHFTNYSSVCSYQDCNFVSAANWEEVVLGLDPSVAALQGEYANAGQTFGGGLNMSQLWSYWRTQGIDGAIATKVVSYAHNKGNTELAVSNLGALIVEDVTKKADYMGTVRHGAGTAIMVIDGFDPKGPLVVYQAKTIQMTWAQWGAQVRGMWGITASTSPATTATITFNANGGSGVMANESESLNVATALTPNGFTHSGYSFNGWNTAANGGGTSYPDGSVYPFATSTTLYAQWIVTAPTMATITFNANGGVGTMAPETETLNVSAVVTTNTFARTGYTFSGWNTAANGSGTSFTNNELVQFTVSTTFYAQWTAVPITVPFSGQASSNWSGYVLPTTSLDTLASAEWTVPRLNCTNTPNGSSATWVGIGGVTWSDGSSSGSLLQTGTEDDCVNGVQVDSGWFEIVPATPNHEETFTNFPVNPGNIIRATEGYVNGQWGTLLDNLSTGLSAVFMVGSSWEVVTTATSTPVGGIQGDATGTSYSGAYSVEWIQEDVTSAGSGSLFTLPNYGSVTFFNLRTSLSSWSLPNSDAYEITNNNGVPVSVPGPVVNSGFTVTYTGP